MASQEWLFEAQVTVTNPHSYRPIVKNVYLPDNFSRRASDTVQRNSAISPLQYQNINRTNGGGSLRMECSWHSSPNITRHHSYEAPSRSVGNVSSSFSRNYIPHSHSTLPRPKSYHADQSKPLGEMPDYLTRIHSSDDVSANGVACKSLDHGYKVTFASHVYPNQQKNTPVQSPSVCPSYAVRQSPLKDFNEKLAHEKSRLQQNKEAIRNIDNQTNLKSDKSCKSTCNITLENNLTPLSEFDTWVKRPYTKSLSEPFIRLDDLVNVDLTLPSQDIDANDLSRNVKLSRRPRSQSYAHKNYVAHFCSHIPGRRALSYSASEHQSASKAQTLSETMQKSTSDQYLHDDTVRTTFQHGTDVIRKKEEQKDTYHKKKNKNLQKNIVSGIDKKTKPRTIHIDVYCSDDEENGQDDDDDNATLCNSSDEERQMDNFENEPKENVVKQPDKEKVSNFNLTTDVEKLADEHQRKESFHSDTSSQMSSKPRLTRRSPFRSMKDICDTVQRNESYLRGEKEVVCNISPPIDVSNKAPIEVFKRAICPIKYGKTYHHSLELPLTDAEKCLEVNKPFTKRTGQASSHFQTAEAFGSVLKSVKKPGHHVGPARNKFCNCVHCQKFFTNSISNESEMKENSTSAGIKSTTGDHVGTVKPF